MLDTEGNLYGIMNLKFWKSHWDQEKYTNSFYTGTAHQPTVSSSAFFI